MKKTILKCAWGILLGVASGFGLPLAAEENHADRPNILWITCEDISPNLGCYGDAYARTPVFDELATQAVRYSNGRQGLEKYLSILRQNRGFWAKSSPASAVVLNDLVKQVTLKNSLSSYVEVAESEDYDWPLSAFYLACSSFSICPIAMPH